MHQCTCTSYVILVIYTSCFHTIPGGAKRSSQTPLVLLFSMPCLEETSLDIFFWLVCWNPSRDDHGRAGTTKVQTGLVVFRASPRLLTRGRRLSTPPPHLLDGIWQISVGHSETRPGTGGVGYCILLLPSLPSLAVRRVSQARRK